MRLAMDGPDGSLTAATTPPPKRARGVGPIGAAVWFGLVGGVGGVASIERSVDAALQVAPAAGALSEGNPTPKGLVDLFLAAVVTFMGGIVLVLWLVALAMCLLHVSLAVRMLRGSDYAMRLAPWVAALVGLFFAFVAYAHAGQTEYEKVFGVAVALAAGHSVSFVVLLVDRRGRRPAR